MNAHRPSGSTPRWYPGPIRTMAAMQPRLVAIALLAVALVGCDVAAATPLNTTPGAPAASAVAGVPGATAPPGTAAPGTGAPGTTPAPATTAPAAQTTAPTAPPRTNPPAPPTGAKVTILPASSGKLGSSFLLQLGGWPAGRVTETVTNPSGIPKSAFLTVGQDGTSSATFQTQTSDQIGRYIFRFDMGTLQVTTSIDITR
jgi:hypothetical protein